MLRRAMYASLVESKKPSPSKLSQQHSTTIDERTSDNVSHNVISVESSIEAVNNKHCSNHGEFDNNNKPDQNKDVQSVDAHAIPSLGNAKTTRNKKISKEPSKLLNYVIKKKKEKKMKLKALFRSTSPSILQSHSDTGVTGFTTSEHGAVSIKRHSPTCSVPCNGKSKKRKRQRGALAVFVAMNKSAGGKINNHGLSKELLLKTKKKRRRKRKNLESEGCQAGSNVNLDGSRQCGVESEESPAKKSRREEKKK